MPRWTNQQKNAIDARNSNIIVSAAAGSGKTAVLVERVIKMITDAENPVGVDRLLIVTFTNPAAAEMKSRISARLQKILREDPSNSNALKQMSLLPSAKICTIDSFCLNLVRDNFFKLGISQDFTVLDETEVQIIADNALNTVLDNCFEEKDKHFISLVEMLSSPKDDKALVSSIKRLHTYIYAQPRPMEWLRNAAEAYNPGITLEESIWFESIKELVSDGLKCGISLIHECIALLDEADEAYDKYITVLNSDLALFTSLENAMKDSWDSAYCAFSQASFSQLRGKRGYTPPYKADVAVRRDMYKDIVKKQLAPIFCADSNAFREDNEKLYPILQKLCDVVECYDNEFRALKDERNGYTFSDVEHMALSLLTDADHEGNIIKSQLAKDLESSFYEILVDEYQDTNEAQDTLFELLSNGRNRFMVGDVKQSIYRFRLAMPFIFNEKKDSYSDYDSENENINSRIILDKNFRSRKGICDYVNFVFSAFMSAKTGELDYNEREYLNYGAVYPESDIPSAFIKILTNTKGADFDKNEAVYIANTILEKINSKEQIFDGERLRPINFGDFAILLRSTKSHIAVYNEVLSSFGIPVISDNSTNLFENNEIQMLLSFLRVIDNPMQDIPLLAVMMSPLYGFTADELTQIKLEQNNTKCSLYTSVVNSESEKVKAFLEEIEMFRKVVITMSVSSFIRFVCEYKSIYAFANALGNGEQRCRNISKFISFAEGFDSSQSIGLTSFMRLVNKVAESDKGIDSAAVHSIHENAVTIMSVHHSKGLEFPVVILAGAERKYNYDDLRQRLLLHPKYGLGVKLHNEELLYQTETIPNIAVKNQNKTAMISENLRVLYVALTRAKEQFISFVTVDNLENKINKLAPYIAGGKMNPYICRNLLCDGDLLLLSALTHPDGRELRKLSDIDVKIRPADFKLDVQMVHSVDDIKEAEETLPVSYDADIVNRIADKLEYKYENAKLSAVSAKRNASELDESIKSLEFFASSKPAFMNAGGLTPGQKGTAMHSFMQFCNYECAKNNLEAEISRLTESGYISAEEANSLNRTALGLFFESEFAKRMFEASHIYREIKVSSFVKLSELDEFDSEEEVLVRGISDCVFEEKDGLVLVDYKTDKVQNETELLSRYENQIGFYRRVIEKTLEKPVKEAALYSFYLGKVCYYK